MSTPTPTIPTPAAPSAPDINSSQQDLAAAVRAANQVAGEQPAPPAPAPVAPPPATATVAAPPPAAPPATADWGNLTENPDGTVNVSLATGEIFKGTPKEALAALAKSKVDTTMWARQQVAAQPTAPAAPVATPTTPTAIDSNAWWAAAATDPIAAINDAVAKFNGFDNAEQMRVAVSQMNQTTDATIGNQIATQFLSTHQDFPNTDAASEKLLTTLAERNLPVTTQNLEMAHAYCIQQGHYKPLSKEEQQAALLSYLGLPAANAAVAPPAPPPVIPSTGTPVAASTEEPNINWTQEKLAAWLKANAPK